jgi:hypothetical protein
VFFIFADEKVLVIFIDGYKSFPVLKTVAKFDPIIPRKKNLP